MSDMNKISHSNELTLITGATGKTGRRIVERLAAHGVPARVASRGPTRLLTGAIRAPGAQYSMA